MPVSCSASCGKDAILKVVHIQFFSIIFKQQFNCLLLHIETKDWRCTVQGLFLLGIRDGDSSHNNKWQIVQEGQQSCYWSIGWQGFNGTGLCHEIVEREVQLWIGPVFTVN